LTPGSSKIAAACSSADAPAAAAAIELYLEAIVYSSRSREPMAAFYAMTANDQKHLSSSLIAVSASALSRALKVGVL
jgi:hypothetical protein